MKAKQKNKSKPKADDATFETVSTEVLKHLSTTKIDDDDSVKLRIIVNRGETCSITVDEIDPLQVELESSLLKVTRRSKLLLNVLEVPSLASSSTVILPKEKAHSTPVSQKNSKFKIVTRPVNHEILQNSSSSSRGRCRSPQRSNLVSNNGRPVRFRIYNIPNEFPDRFWKFVEDYCAPCNQEDITYLEELIAQCSESALSEYLNVPGQPRNNQKFHVEHDRAEKSAVSRKSVVHENVNGCVPKRLKIDQSSDQSTQGSYGDRVSTIDLGPLTQRLIQALMEDKPPVPVVDEACLENTSEAKDFPELNGVNSSPSMLVKTLNLGNYLALEKKIKKELQNEGLLEPEMPSDEEDCSAEGSSSSDVAVEDEVTTELKKRQAELKLLCETNRKKLEHLSELAKMDIKRQQLKKHLQEINDRVIEICNRHFSSIPRKKLNKKEIDQIERILKERTSLSKEIEALSVQFAPF